MTLYLVQHGKAIPKEIDPDQGISDEGSNEVARIAEIARGYAVRVSVIKHSGKKRARQTAELFAAVLRPEGGVLEVEGMKPMDDVTAFAARVRDEDNVMYVGHLPFMERLTSYLTAGSPEKLVFKFQNGGIVSLDFDSHRDAWYIKWTLMPHIGT